MAQLRLFTAVDLPEEIIQALADLVERLRPLARIGWSRADNYHITMKFIGAWPGAKLREIEDTLRTVPRRDPVSVRLSGLAFFPHTLWAGVDGPGLAPLAADTEQALSRLGIPAEERRFSPHLTLARIRERQRFDALRQEVAKLGSIEFGSFRADRFHLYSSSPGPSGSVYTKLSEYPF